MKTETHSCARGYTPTIIASWHDGALAAAEMDRVRTHIPTCAACQAWQAECESLDAALRTQRVPEPSGRLWNDVRLGMSGTAQSHRRMLRPTASFGQVARAALAMSAVALIVLSFARVLGSRAGTQHPIAAAMHTATKPAGTPTPPPNWQPVATPFTATDADALGIAVSATDGNTAYLCYAHPFPAGAQPTIYVTHDRGAHWALISHLPTQGNLDFADCVLTVDALNPSDIAATVSMQNIDTLKSSVMLYTSMDGGTSWVIHSGIVELYGFTTLGGRSYAIWSQGTDITNASFPRLAVSTDGMRTWQPIDAQFNAQELSVLQFWVRPGDGALLAEVGVAARPGVQQPLPTLWQSTDGGDHWTQLPAPQVQNFVVAQPVASQPWQICAYSNSNFLACSADSGQTWVARPVLFGRGVSVLSITADGSLLDVGEYGTVKNGVVQYVQRIVLYQLPAGSSQWEYRGPEPANALFYVAQPGNGVLWAYAGGSYPGNPLSGPLGQTGAGFSIFTADYP